MTEEWQGMLDMIIILLMAIMIILFVTQVFTIAIK